MPKVPSAPHQHQCPEPEPQEDNVYEFDVSQPEKVEPVPFSALTLNIPGQTKPYVGYDGAINKAAKNLNPEKGLLVLLNPYIDMKKHDFVELFFGDKNIAVAFTTVTELQENSGSPIPLYVPYAWLEYGAHDPCFFKVTRAGGGDAETLRFKYFIDDFEPAGPKPLDESSHRHMDAPKFEQHIVDDGVTEDDANKGVKITIAKYPNRTGLSPRYNWAARDTIWLTFNGHPVTHSVTEGEAAGSELVITVYAADWKNFGSGDVVVQYFVIDEAKNRSGAASPVTIIQSLIGDPHPLLGQPFIAEVNDEGRVDINLLEGAPATAVINVPGNGYLKYDDILLSAKGYTYEGAEIEKVYHATINSVFVNLNIPIDFDFLESLVGGSLQLRFQRIRAGVTPNRRSRVNVLEVIGNASPVGLAPPTVLQAPEGNIPADSAVVTVKINSYVGQNPFDAVLLLLSGTYPTGANYYREIGPRPAGTGNILFNITNGPMGDFANLEGGTLDINYTVTNEQGTRPSQTANFDIGELIPTLPTVDIEEAPPPDYVFNPVDSLFGATVIVRTNTAFTIGSTVTLYFDGSTAGGSWSKPFPITSVWIGKDLYFDVPRAIVVANQNYSARIYHTLSKPNERIRLSHAVDMRVGASLNLPVPEILESTVVVPGKSATMNPLHVSGGVYPAVFTIRVRYPMLNTDTIHPHFRGKAGMGNPSITPKPGNESTGFVDFTVINTAAAANIDSHVPVDYFVTRGTKIIPSDELDLFIERLPASSVKVVSIPEAIAGQVNTHINNSVRVGAYPFLKQGQAVWVKLNGSKNYTLREGTPLSAAEFTAKQINEFIPQSYLLSLIDGSNLTVEVSVSMDGTGLENSAVRLDNPTYTVNRQSGVIDTIAVGTGPRHIAFSRDGSLAYVTNIGSHTVSVINTATRTVVRTISGFSIPYRLTLHPDGTRIFVGNLGAHTVSVINLATNTIVQTLTGFHSPYGIAFNATGSKVYISCNHDAFVYVHDAATGARLSSLKVLNPHGLAFTPDYARLYAVCNTNITPINPEGNGTVLPTIAGGNYPPDIVFKLHNYSAPMAYIPNHGFYGTVNEVLVLNYNTNSVSKVMTGFSYPRGVAANPITERVYISEKSGNRVAVIDTTNDTVIQHHSGLNRPEGMAVTMDGLYLWVCDTGANRISIIAL